ncbi:MAG: hypothetical protein U9Q99_02395 [Nanoarchaeota archaeon]|nr:hypothetical protein [Nanoarchaeota archaeon]
MKTKNLLVSLCTLALVLMLAVTVSAADIVNNATYKVTVNGMDAYPIPHGSGNVSVIAGEEIIVKVYFDALNDDTDVTVELEIDGEKVKTHSISENFDVEKNMKYKKVLSIKVPYELKDQISDSVTLEIEVDGKDHKSDLAAITLNVQRPSYNAMIKSITTPSSIQAGESFPIELVLKNRGYNNLDDIYVSTRIVGLNVFQGPKWFGDLVAVENCTQCDNEEDTVAGTMYLNVPYSVQEGIYTLEVIVDSDDSRTVELRTIVIGNSLPNTAIPTTTKQTVAVGEDAVYELMLVNPTNNVMVYTIITGSNSALTSSASQSIVAVEAGSSKVITITANAEKEGTQTFDVTILSNNQLIDTVTLELEADGNKSNPIVILTVILAIIFLVLLVVLIVLLGKKPEKTEDFGESYY